ncbi:hypothetical protein P0M11_05800 [Kaistella sp. PBT33-4]|uniref:hypothetical protein n=1 Tax=Kaistella sp. PBT33-4 TaxID=3032000 RepID=UPI0023D840E0|nr:hypothetical protein [Kaistella sp. PBT33-4]MDF0719511.1 hypothetical protein [Kaistella sp. PBT33-4]
MDKLEIKKGGVPYLFRYRSNSDFTIDEIKNNYIFFPNSKMLNDPFDASHRLVKIDENEGNILKSISVLKERLKNHSEIKYFNNAFPNKEHFVNFLKEGIVEFINQTGIACFSISPVNIMLWANYANNHQGICVQYNIEYDRNFFNTLGNVEYVDNLEILNYSIGTERESNAIRKMFFKKLRLWREEYEIRLIKSSPGKHYFESTSVRSIVFGLRTPKEFQEKIIETVTKYNSHIELYQSELMENGIGITLTKIDIK